MKTVVTVDRQLVKAIPIWSEQLAQCIAILQSCSQQNTLLATEHFAKFLHKVWKKNYFGDMKGSKFIAVLFSWNYKVSKYYELLLKGMPHPIRARGWNLVRMLKTRLKYDGKATISDNSPDGVGVKPNCFRSTWPGSVRASANEKYWACLGYKPTNCFEVGECWKWITM